MNKVLNSLVVSLLFLLLVLPGTAAADPTIAEVENLGDTLVFHPVVQFSELLLTVTGPCDFLYQQRVEEGEPFFRLDATTIDGMYTYNLVRLEAVDPSIVEILQDARKNFDEETPKQLCRDGKLPAAPIAQAEGFRVFKSQIVFDPGSFEKAAGDFDVTVDRLAAIKPEPELSAPARGPGALPTKDFVINDDLIVDGSACIGFDCVNGEVFSFDTIRLKENNLRIKFDDTSVVPSFPANDWQLTANESANGGASKFSIEDISGSRTPFTVEANARSHSLYVDDGGRIGSRTSTPSTEIHTIDGDTPTLRLQQDGSSGFEPQTWDVAGNETNFFIRDVTNGSALPFRIRPGAPTSSIFVDVDGDVGLGTSSPNAPLHVILGGSSFSPNASTSMVVQNNAGSGDAVAVSLISGDTGSANGALNFGTSADEFAGRILYTHGTTNAMRFFANGSERMRLLSDGKLGIGVTTVAAANDIEHANGARLTTGGAWTNASSRVLKENIHPLSADLALETVRGLDPVTYNYKRDPAEGYVGFIAEDVPEAVALNDRKGLSAMDIVAVLTKVVQEQQRTIEELHSKMTELESKMEP